MTGVQRRSGRNASGRGSYSRVARRATLRMRLAGFRILFTICVIACGCLASAAQDLKRDINIAPGGLIEVVNRAGRISAKAVPSDSDETVVGKLTVTSP